MKLYSNSFSPNCRRPRICAAEIGLPLEVVELDFAKGEWKTPGYLTKNPMGKVPTLEDDGYLLWESPAMLVYLAAKAPQKGLHPAGAREQAEVARWMFWNASHLENAITTFAFEKIVKPMLGQTPDEGRMASGQADWKRFAPVLDAHLAGKDWIIGSAFTIADIAIGVSVEFAVMAGLEISSYRNVEAWLGRLRERPSWKA